MQKIRNIKSRFSIIEKNISDIVEKKYIFEKFNEYIKSNKLLDHDEFIGLIVKNYLDIMIVDICKWVDEDGRSESLINLLKDLKSKKDLICLEWFISRYPDFLKDNGKNDFRQFSTKNNYRISSQKIDNDIKKIKQIVKGRIFGKKRFSANSLARLRNARKAHHNRGVFITTATIADLVNAVDILEKMVLKYNLLLNQSAIDGLLASNIDDYINFEKIFKNNS